MMKQLQPIEHMNQRILTTQQIAKEYGTDAKHINDNFLSNKNRYTIGKHYYSLEGKELSNFINLYPEIFGAQNISKIRILYLWTEKGAWLHAKSLNTDRAWEAYELLVDEYYRIRNQQPQVVPTQLEFDFDFMLHIRTSEDITYAEAAIRAAKEVINAKEKLKRVLTGKVSDHFPGVGKVIPDSKQIEPPSVESLILKYVDMLKEPTLRLLAKYIDQNIPGTHLEREAVIKPELMLLVRQGVLIETVNNRTSFYSRP